MLSKNNIQLTGRVTKAPQIRQAGGNSVCHARLIHNDTFTRADGETIERLVALDLEIWGKRGETFAEHITTKVPVYIEGRLQLNEWEQDGEARSRLVVTVTEWQFLAPPRAERGDQREEVRQTSSTATTRRTSNRRAQRVA